jgi:hypothetical protein
MIRLASGGGGAAGASDSHQARPSELTGRKTMPFGNRNVGEDYDNTVESVLHHLTAGVAAEAKKRRSC